MKKISLVFIYLISFIFMEFFYKIIIYKDIFRISIISMLIFLISFSIFLSIITKLFKNEKVNKIIFIIIMSLIAIWFSAQYVIKSYFNFYISLSTFQIADQVRDFAYKGIVEVLKRLPGILIFFLPLILSLIFSKKIDFEKKSFKKYIVLLCMSIGFYGVFLSALNIKKSETYSSYDLYYNINDVSLNVENFGVLNTFLIDTKRAIFGFHEKIHLSSDIKNEEETSKKEEEIVYEYNNLNINFDELINKETNSNIKELHEYFKNDAGTLQNEYTGIFKGKNLILFMAESFNEIAVNEKLTPTLYKLVNNGFVFNNFYTPTIYSTIGGEFQELTGLYAGGTDILSKFRSGNLAFPQGVANKFKEINYKTFAYHNNSYRFQDRNKYLKSMGFDNFLACNNGLEALINCKEWPESDVDMINATVNDYINEDNFMVFYATVSGHATYKFDSNAQARKHRDEYNSYGFNYSEGPASYLAAQMELDKSLETLIKKLDESGKLNDTVIALVGDHYPYELSIDEINEISSYEKEERVTVNKSNFILWNNEMEKVEVNKVGSELDVIPTIYNSFGIDYDSRLFIGKDILSTTEGLAIFADRSWVTNKGIYYAATKKFVPTNNEEVSDEYINNMNKIVNNKIVMSKLIIENDYYRNIEIEEISGN